MKRSPLKRKTPLFRSGRSKFGNIETEYNGVLYRSRAEANYAMWLDSEKKAGKINSWEYEQNISLEVNGKKICDVMWDFLVTFANEHKEYHEMKGKKTDLFRLKEKLFRALYPNIYLKVIDANNWSSR